MDLQGVAKALRDTAAYLDEKDALLKQSKDLSQTLAGYKENIEKANWALLAYNEKIEIVKAEYEAEAKKLAGVKSELDAIRKRVA